MAFLFKLSLFLIALQTAFYFTNGFPSSPTSISSMVQMPESCRDTTYCFDKENYPMEIVENLLKEKSLNLQMFAPAINHRIEDDEDEYINMGCKKTLRKMPIYYILDENKDVRVVLQHDKYFTQIIPVQKCERSEAEPSELFNQQEIDLKGLHCENLTLKYNFLVLSKDLTSIEFVQNSDGLPVDCVCRAGRSN